MRANTRSINSTNLRSLLLYFFCMFLALINSIVCWFHSGISLYNIKVPICLYVCWETVSWVPVRHFLFFVLAVYDFLTRAILLGLTLKMFDICVHMHIFCFVYGLILWIWLESLYKKCWNVHLLMTVWLFWGDAVQLKSNYCFLLILHTSVGQR